jgi:hypothetical protein
MTRLAAHLLDENSRQQNQDHKGGEDSAVFHSVIAVNQQLADDGQRVVRIVLVIDQQGVVIGQHRIAAALIRGRLGWVW